MSRPAPKPPADIEASRAEMDASELDFANAKLAFYGRTEYKGSRVEFEDPKRYAETFIGKNRAFHRARWAKVRTAQCVEPFRESD